MSFDVDEEYEELEIVGNLVCVKGGKIAIDWQKVAGNSFWLASIVGSLNT